jgi:PPK2 family polyphosphate:nucleotide phosphotransferase
MKSFRLEPGSKINMKDLDPSGTGDFDAGKKDGMNELKGLLKELDSLQELLYAQHQHKVLIVLQAMDTVPTPIELEHDYLWRIHWQAPGNGEMVIFNRSHYEDVLVVRVHRLVPVRVWKARYQQINDFEKMLSQEGTLILKFFLNISQEEQKKRFQARLENETKQWKFNPDDLKERALWTDYMQAYEDLLNKTTTDYAPWYVVPSDHKWFRDLVVADAIVHALKELKMEYPKPVFDVAASLQEVEKLA